MTLQGLAAVEISRTAFLNDVFAVGVTHQVQVSAQKENGSHALEVRIDQIKQQNAIDKQPTINAALGPSFGAFLFT